MTRTVQTRNSDRLKINAPFLASILFLLVLLSPYYRGLYFDYEKYPFFVVINGVIFVWLLWHISRKEWFQPPDTIEWFFIGFILLYFLNIFLAADKGVAFQEFINYVTYFLLFVSTKRLQIPSPLKRTFLLLLGINSLILAIMGFSYQMGWIRPEDTFLKMSFRDLFIGGRLNTSFQYPNTACAYFAMGYLAVLTFILLERKSFWRILSSLVSFVVLGAFFFTYSRGGYLTFPLSIFFLLFVLQAQSATRLLIYSLESTVILLLFFSKGEELLFKSNPLFFGYLLAGGSIFAILGEFTTQFFQKVKIMLDKKNLAILVFLILASSIVFFTIAVKTDFLPHYLTQRIKSISLQTQSVSERILFYKDALKIFLLRPLNGWGGGAWKTLYFKFQSTPYFTESTHNFYVQILVESGTLGFLFLLGVFVLTFRKVLQVYSEPEEQVLQRGILSVLLMGLLHSTIDVNFSLGAFQLTMWFFAGLALSRKEFKEEKTKKKSIHHLKMPTLYTMLLALTSSLLLILCFMMSQSTSYAIRAEYYLSKNLWKEASFFAEKAIRFNPWNAETHLIYSKALRFQFLSEERPFLRTKSLEEAQRACLLAPQSYRYLQHLGFLFVEMGKFELGISYLEKAIQSAPLIPTTYEGLISAFKAIGDFYFSKSEKTKATEYYERAKETVTELYRLQEKYPQIKISKDLAELTKELLKYKSNSKD